MASQVPIALKQAGSSKPKVVVLLLRGEYFGQQSEIYDIWNAELFCFWTDFEIICFS